MDSDSHLNNYPLLPVAMVLMTGIVAGDAACAHMGMDRCGAEALARVDQWLKAGWAVVMLGILVALFFHKRHVKGIGVLLYLIVFLMGALLLIGHSRQLAFPFSQARDIHYEAVVIDAPRTAGKTVRFDCFITVINGQRLRHAIKTKAFVVRDSLTDRWRYLAVGKGFEAISMVEPPVALHHQGHFDYQRWLRVHGFRAQTLVFADDWRPARVPLSSLSWWQRLRLRALQQRQRLVERYFAKPTGKENDSVGDSDADNQAMAIITSMVLGDRHALSYDTKELYSATGASHILALSGLHLGIIYAVLTLLLGRWRRWQWLMQAIALSAVWVYVVLVGMGASVVRSALMLTVYAFCLVAYHGKSSFNVLSFAAIVLLLANPFSLWDVSFQLSFMAVLAIMVYYRPLNRLVHTTFKPLKTLWSMMAVSLAAQLGTAPLVAYYFERFSTYFLLTNAIVIPFAFVIIYGALLLMACSVVPAVAAPVGKALVMVSGALNACLSWVASLPGSSLRPLHPNLIQLYLIYILIASITLLIAKIVSLQTKE